MDADSDGDVVLHAICNAITSVSHVPILGGVAIEMCKNGITDSRCYLEKAVESLGSIKIQHVALSIEGSQPRMQKRVDAVRENVAKLLVLPRESVGMTVTSGDGLTDFGKGLGLMCYCLLTVVR